MTRGKDIMVMDVSYEHSLVPVSNIIVLETGTSTSTLPYSG